MFHHVVQHQAIIEPRRILSGPGSPIVEVIQLVGRHRLAIRPVQMSPRGGILREIGIAADAKGISAIVATRNSACRYRAGRRKILLRRKSYRVEKLAVVLSDDGIRIGTM